MGKRLVSARPLARQKVDKDDSVLADYRKDDGHDAKGLEGTYGRMVEEAFQKTWWRSDQIAIRQPDGSTTIANGPDRPLLANEYTMKEYNFSLFFGLAVQLYEMTLISDDSPVDRYFDGDGRALTHSADSRTRRLYRRVRLCRMPFRRRDFGQLQPDTDGSRG